MNQFAGLQILQIVVGDRGDGQKNGGDQQRERRQDWLAGGSDRGRGQGDQQ